MACDEAALLWRGAHHWRWGFNEFTHVDLQRHLHALMNLSVAACLVPTLQFVPIRATCTLVALPVCRAVFMQKLSSV